MRRTVCFGRDDEQINFGWPTENDLLQMPRDQPIQLTDMQYKVCSKEKKRFGAI